MAEPKLKAFPVFMCVEGEIVAIIGEGDEALAKARLLSQSAARLRIVAPDPEPALAAWIAENDAEHVSEPYQPHHLNDARLVFAASGDENLDRRIAGDAQRLGVIVNAVDRPDLCDFYTPALVNRAPVCIAIGTEGTGPVLSQMLRARIDRMLAPSLGALASLAESFRAPVENYVAKGAARRRFWSSFFNGEPARYIASGQVEEARAAAAELLIEQREVTGHVSVIDAGHGAPDLLTIRAQRHLMEADVIVHDRFVPDEIIDMGRRDAERIAADMREAGALLLRLAKDGKRVVRLTTCIAEDEVTRLRAAHVSFEIVPAAAALADRVRIYGEAA